jgi:toxin ParE1/3/4
VNSSVSREAERELLEGALFYAREANADLGLAFIEEFERAIDLLRAYPRLGSVWRGTPRRFPLRRFPYSIIYQIKPDKSGSLRSHTRAEGPATGAAANKLEC